MPRSLLIPGVIVLALVLGAGGFLAGACGGGDGGSDEAAAETEETAAADADEDQGADAETDVDMEWLLPELEELLAEGELLEELEASLADETPKEPFVGVTLAEEDGEVVVIEVVRGSPAARAGIDEGDVIVAVDGTLVQTRDDVAQIVGESEKGDELTFAVRRNGEELEIDVRVTERPVLSGQFEDSPRPLLPDGAFPSLLGSMVLEELLERFAEAEIAFLNDEGERETIRLFAGAVADVSDDGIEVAPNGGGQKREFEITDDTRVRYLLPSEDAEPEAGDRVLVVVRGDGDRASRIVVLPAERPQAEE